MIITRKPFEQYLPKDSKTDDILTLIFMAMIGALAILWANDWDIPAVNTPNYYRAEYYERDITAYNVGVEAQTDDTPCIGASGIDICKALERGERVAAANFVPLGTKLNIEGLGTFVVLDRMNKRYPNRVDIAFPADQINEALEFGVKQLSVGVIK